MTLINILDNEFLDPPPVVLDRVRFVMYIKQEASYILEVDEKCVKVDDKMELEL